MAEFKPIAQADFVAKRRKQFGPLAMKARFDAKRRMIVITFDKGFEVALEVDRAFDLTDASNSQLSEVVIAGAGDALHFPRLDADFSIPRLLEGFLGPMDWTRKLARAEASRRNGKLGGRPAKVAA